MDFVYTLNGNFSDKVGASLCSLFENNKESVTLNVYLIVIDMNEKDKKLFTKFGEAYQRKITIIEVESINQYFDFEYDTTGWNQIVLARLILDKLLPKTLDRIVYLDGDTIVINSVQQLWQVNMGESVVGACIEATVNANQKKSLQMGNIPYINAGVLLINLRKWRQRETGKRIISYYKKHNGMLFANDQDAINGSLKEEIFYLDPKYNFYNIYWHYPYRVLKKIMGNSFYYSKETVAESILHPVIIHYLGEERPWRKGNTHKYRKEYCYYLKKTPWKDTPQEKGWQIYFFAWRTFNLIMYPFPMMRYKIITKLIPQIIKFRAKKIKKN